MPALLVLAIALVLAAAAGPAVAVDAPPPGSRPDRVSPLRDPRGLHPGLSAVPVGRRADARALVLRVRTAAPGTRRGYDRDAQYGEAWTDAVDTTWGRDGCRTREQILHRDLRAIEFRAGTGECVVLEGTLQDPYTGRTIFFSKARPTEVQVDHVVPLAYGHRQGARRWTQAKRERFANDPLNLLAVDGPTNQSKSDSGPAAWLPPSRRVRCAYAVRFAQVALKYALTVTGSDRRTMRALCR